MNIQTLTINTLAIKQEVTDALREQISVGIHGLITAYEIPSEWSDEDFQYWWLPVTDKTGHIIQPARISDEAKAQRICQRAPNLITNNGMTLLLNTISLPGIGQLYPFTQILSVGNGGISGVTRSDTAVAGDGFATNSRKAPSPFSITGFTTTIVTNFASGDAVGTWTNIGWYSFNISGAQSATTTAGTGVLGTHALFNYVKGSSAIAVDYTFTLSN